MTVHHAAAEGYATTAGAFARGRPGYPPETSDWLRDVIALGPGKTVLEVGAGTGKFLPLLLATGAEVTALEPVGAMHAEMARRFPEIKTLRGTADRIGLPDASVDAVVCAQAFHWFATPEAVAEMRRVLRPGGVLGMIWNGRDEGVPWVAAMGAIIDPHESDAPRYQTGKWRQVFPAPGFTALDERHARNLHTGSPDDVILGRTLSISFIAVLPPERRAEIERQLRTLIEQRPELVGRAEISLPYDTLMVAVRKIG
ncbi:MAG TPA: class I SAM-dependent methyltransferase [Stellaceae bacterium]|jgi:SAM-dependent methyltransferase|nr:class I SAM-dependent methyltransferase [Stellaceae bacterium]